MPLSSFAQHFRIFTRHASAGAGLRMPSHAIQRMAFQASLQISSAGFIFAPLDIEASFRLSRYAFSCRIYFLLKPRNAPTITADYMRISWPPPLLYLLLLLRHIIVLIAATDKKPPRARVGRCGAVFFISAHIYFKSGLDDDARA